jgi:purine catabolism regulator
MDFQKPFTVADVLKRPLFQQAKLVAGAKGLTRPIHWVHVLEVSNAASLVNGGELILTTGVGLGSTEESLLQFVRQLVESQVSGLCIELGQRFTEIPTIILRYAEEHDFPVIVFEKEVRFIDITQDIHAYIINRHHQQLLALEAISNQFLQLTLRPQGILQILKLLHQETGCPVWLRDELGIDIVYPEEAATEFQEKPSLCHPVIALDMHVGELHLAHHGKRSEFLQLILDRAATAIAQELLRRLSLEERRLRMMQKWINEWLHHGHAKVPTTVKSALKAGGSLVLAAIRTAETESPVSHTWHEDFAILQWLRLVHRAFEPYGLQGWLAPQENLWALVLADVQPSSPLSMLERVRKGFIDFFGQLAAHTPACGYRWNVGVSLVFRHLSVAPHFWKQAKLALKIDELPGSDTEIQKNEDKHRKKPSDRFTLVCYDDLQAWQLFLQVDPTVLSEFVRHQIGPLIDYDRQNGTKLVQTLETFFATGQSKQQTAKELYIHRQTLYYRLEQISSLLGNNWETPVRRLALATALAAHRFLSVQENRSLPEE